MASHSSRDRPSRRRRPNRHSRSVESVLEVDDDVIETRSTTCIDLTADVSGEDIIDLTRSQSLNIMDSPIVVLTAADDVGPIRSRRGSGRRGRRRYSRRNVFGSGVDHFSPVTPRGGDRHGHQVHVLPSDDSDSDELPDLPFEVPPANAAANNSILQSPEGIKVTCPVCMDDIKQIRRNGRQVMSTTCGHIFCDTCIRTAINTQHACPSCRKKLSSRSIHPLFI